MNTLFISILALVFGILSAEDTPALPLAALSQLQGFDHTQARLKKDYQDKLDAAELKVIKSLKDMETAEGRDGHLDMAINLKLEVDKLQAEIDKRDLVIDPMDFSSLIVGTWHVTRADGHDGTWVFTADGVAKCVQSNIGEFSGTWSLQDNADKTSKILHIIWNGNSATFENIHDINDQRFLGDGWNCGSNSVNGSRIADTTK